MVLFRFCIWLVYTINGIEFIINISFYKAFALEMHRIVCRATHFPTEVLNYLIKNECQERRRDVYMKLVMKIRRCQE